MSHERAKRFAALYEDSYGAIHAYAARRAGAEAADEIAAETFLVAWRKVDALPSDPLPWLYGVARNMVARDHAASGRQRQTARRLSVSAVVLRTLARMHDASCGPPGSS